MQSEPKDREYVNLKGKLEHGNYIVETTTAQA